MTPQAKGLLITTLGALIVVPDSLFIRLIDAEPMVIAFWRAMNAGMGIFIGVMLVQGPAPFRAVLGTGWHGVVYVITLAASGFLFVQAVSHTSVANVVVIIASMPVFAALFSWLFMGERIGPRMVKTMIAVALGLAIIGYGSGATENAHLFGDALALLLAASFAAGLTAARRVRAVSMVPAIPIAYVGSALLMWPFIDPLSVPAEDVWIVALHGVFIVASATLLALGPRYITSAEVALLILLETVLAPLLAWYVIGENPGIWALIGGGVVIGSLALSNAVVLLRRR